MHFGYHCQTFQSKTRKEIFAKLKQFCKISFVLVLATVVVLIDYDFAHAYLDPGTGSYIFQLLMAGLLGALLALKIFWRNIKTYISNLFNKNRDGGSE